MRRRTVLNGLGVAVGTSLAGCLDGGSNGDDGSGTDTVPWLNRIELDVDRETNQMKVVARVSAQADISEVGLYGPNDDLVHSSIVGEGKRRVTLGQVDVQTMTPYYFGMEAGAYEVFAVRDGQETDTHPLDLVPEFSPEAVSLRLESREGKQWVSGFQTTVTNRGMYPVLLVQFGPVDGVPNPPSDGGMGSAEPVDADDGIVWPDGGLAFYERRLGDPGPLVVPREAGTPDQDLVSELTGEHTATLEYRTSMGTHTATVDYRLEGDLVTLENGYAMSGGEVLDFTVDTETDS